MRNELYRLRQLPGASEWLIETDNKVSLNTTSDLAKFEEAVCKKDFKQALEIYTGESEKTLISNLKPKDALGFTEWLETKRSQVEELLKDALQGRIVELEKARELTAALELANYLLEYDPLDESTHRTIMRLEFNRGNLKAAQAQFEACSRILAEELGAKPMPETLKLAYEIGRNIPAFLTEEKKNLARQALFVGRTKELNYLQETLKNVYEGKGQVRLVLGSAGQGKSHLLQKFADEAQRANSDLLVLTGYCDQQVGVGDPYLPFRHILLLLLGDVEAKWQGGLISTAHAQRLWEAMEQTVPRVAKYAPDLITSFLVGKPLVERLVLAGLEQEPWFEEVSQLASEKLLGTLEQTRIISLYASALQAIAKVRPILLILEDLHWADASSIELFNYLSRHVTENHILLIGSYRSSEVLANESPHPILKMARELHHLYGGIAINLEDQKVEDERDFVNAYLDSEPNKLDNNFREVFFKHTQGHALFTAELLSTLKDKRRYLSGRMVNGLLGIT